METVTKVHSHVHAISQCRKYLRGKGLEPVVAADTAGAAKDIAEWNDPSQAALASALAGEIYGLVALEDDVQDQEHNVTRFLIMSSVFCEPLSGA